MAPPPPSPVHMVVFAERMARMACQRMGADASGWEPIRAGDLCTGDGGRDKAFLRLAIILHARLARIVVPALSEPLP